MFKICYTLKQINGHDDDDDEGNGTGGGALCQYALRSNTTSSSFIAYSIHITPQKVFFEGFNTPIPNCSGNSSFSFKRVYI